MYEIKDLESKIELHPTKGGGGAKVFMGIFGFIFGGIGLSLMSFGALLLPELFGVALLIFGTLCTLIVCLMVANIVRQPKSCFLTFDLQKGVVEVQPVEGKGRICLPFREFSEVELKKRVVQSSGSSSGPRRSITYHDVRLNRHDGGCWVLFTSTQKEKSEMWMGQFSSRIDFLMQGPEEGYGEDYTPRTMQRGEQNGEPIFYWPRPFPVQLLFGCFFVLGMAVFPWLIDVGIGAAVFTLIVAIPGYILGRGLAKNLMAKQIIHFSKDELRCFSSGLMKDIQLVTPFGNVKGIHVSFGEQFSYVEFALHEKKEGTVGAQLMKIFETGSDEPRILCPELDLCDRLYLEQQLQGELKARGVDKIA